MLTSDMKELIRAFNDSGVKYLLAGGFAYGVHAEPRATKDLDLFISAEVPNRDAVFRALCKDGEPLKASPHRTLETPKRISKPESHPTGSTFSRRSTASASTKHGKIMSTH